MTNLELFLKSIYLGDRYCEKVEINEKRISFQMNCISRLRPQTEKWDFFTEKDIMHGSLVFDNVIEYSINSDRPFNDEIYGIEVIDKKDDIYSFVVYGCNISNESVSTDVEMRIRAKEFYILDSQNNKRITE